LVDVGVQAKDRKRIRAWLKDYRAKAILAEYGVMGCAIARASMEAGVPLYVHFHGYDASILIREWRWVRRYRQMFNVAKGILAPSQFLAGKLAAIGCPESKLHIIPYGVDPARFRPTTREPQMFLAVGRLVDKKAPHLTLRAFAKVRERFPRAELDMVGDGPMRQTCEELVRDLGLHGRVRMHGVKDADFVAALMGRASVFVQHSVTAPNGDMEGLPVAILEAMASSLPVVSTRHSGIPEAVLDNETGLLVDEGDVEGMATHFSALLENPGRAAELGQAGRVRVTELYTLDKARKRLRRTMNLG
jgi:glycosyltransferase involved in cell wall biosynthesis